MSSGEKEKEWVAGRKVHFCCNILLFTTTHNWCEPILKKDRSNCRMSRQRRLRKCVSFHTRSDAFFLVFMHKEGNGTVLTFKSIFAKSLLQVFIVQEIVFENGNALLYNWNWAKTCFVLELSVWYELIVCVLINYCTNFNILTFASYSYLMRKALKALMMRIESNKIAFDFYN